MNKAVFLDRDGTLMFDPGYLGNPEEVALLPDILEGLRALSSAGYLLILITNQSAIGRGYHTAQAVESVNARLVDLLAGEGITVAGVYYCPHRPDEGCVCRKPAPGLLRDAARDHGLDLASCAMVGDKLTDVQAGIAAGCRISILIGPEEASQTRYRAENLNLAAALILGVARGDGDVPASGFVSGK